MHMPIWIDDEPLPPTSLALGEHFVEVRAFDRWRGEQRAVTRYRLDDAQP